MQFDLSPDPSPLPAPRIRVRPTGRFGSMVPMISSPIAHVHGPGQLRLRNGRLIFKAEQQSILSLDPLPLEHLFLYGPVHVSSSALYHLRLQRVDVVWLSRLGTRMLYWMGCHNRRSLTVIRQYQLFANPSDMLLLARSLVDSKLDGLISAVRHYEHNHHRKARPARDRLLAMKDQIAESPDIDHLRGLEGAAARAWFQLLRQLIRPPWSFERRRRRPPTDPVNALLSLGGALLVARINARLQGLGWDSAVGVLHAFRAGKPALACDLAEPLRPNMVDRWVLAMLNQRMVKPDDFQSESEDDPQPPAPAEASESADKEIAPQGEAKSENAGPGFAVLERKTEKKGGVKLKPEPLRRVLGYWEQTWAAGGHDVLLDQWVSNWRLRAERMLGPWTPWISQLQSRSGRKRGAKPGVQSDPASEQAAPKPPAGQQGNLFD